MNERQLAGANYLITFFNEIQNLKVLYSQYVNYLLELKEKHGDNPPANSWDDTEKNTLSMLAQNTRHAVNLCFISYNSIFSLPNIKENTAIEKYYKKIINQYVINSEDLKEFVMLINKALVNDVIKDLMVSSQDIVNKIYQNDNN